MNLIYVHIGNYIPNHSSGSYSYTSNQTPDYLWHSVSNSRKYYKDDIYLLIPRNDLILFDENIKKYNCKAYAYEDYIECNELRIVLEKFSVKFDHFLLVTLLRFIVINNFLQIKKDLKHIIHIENDNLIFEDLKFLETTLDIYFKNKCLFSPVGSGLSSAGIIYWYNYNISNFFINSIVSILNIGEIKLRNQYNYYGGMSEMVILNILKNGNSFDWFPILPFGEHSNYYNNFNFIFDCASYGQYFGGTNNGHNEKVAFDHHIIGQEINKKNIELGWIEEDGNKKPIITYDNKIFKIFNLHIHSKKLNLFI